jgi:hypothetical protein
LGQLGFSWENDLGSSLQESIIQQSVLLLPKGGTIALSSFLNGLVGMKYDWKNNGRIEQALSEGITNQYHPTKRLGGVYSAQGISNIIYYLGELFKERKDGYNIYFSMDVLESFWNGIEKCSNDFHGQSVAMVIYGSVSFFCFSAFCFSGLILDCHTLTLNGINYQLLFVSVSKNQLGSMKTSLLFNRFVMFYQGDLSFCFFFLVFGALFSWIPFRPFFRVVLSCYLVLEPWEQVGKSCHSRIHYTLK